MLNLLKNEWMKIFKRAGTYVMIGLLLLFVTVMAAFIKYQESGGTVPDNSDWQRGIEMQNETLTKELEEYGDTFTPEMRHSYESDIAIGEYRLEHNISPNDSYSVWSFVQDASFVIEFVGMFSIIIAAGIVASEFNWGTIKLLLIRPIRREKILLSKYVTVVLFSLMLLALLFSYSAILGGILFGTPGEVSPYLRYQDGQVIETSMFVHLLTYYGLNSINLFMLTTMAFMISAAFRNSSLAIGLSLFLMFMGGTVTSLVAMRYDWAKYILFANTDLMQYLDGSPLIAGMTMGFSVIMLIIYFLLFQFIAFYTFKKRDVAA